MSVVEEAFDYILVNEGGWSNHAKDKGGATNLGVTIKQFRKAAAEMEGHDFDLDDDGDVDMDDLRKMEKPLAVAIFKRYYWLDVFDRLPRRLAIKTADYGFNMGPTTGVKRLQQAINTLSQNRVLLVDGKLGPKTLQLINLCDENAVLKYMQLEGIRFYKALVERDPEQACFLNGWTNRAMRLP